MARDTEQTLTCRKTARAAEDDRHASRPRRPRRRHPRLQRRAAPLVRGARSRPRLPLPRRRPGGAGVWPRRGLDGVCVRRCGGGRGRRPAALRRSRSGRRGDRRLGGRGAPGWRRRRPAVPRVVGRVLARRVRATRVDRRSLRALRRCVLTLVAVRTGDVRVAVGGDVRPGPRGLRQERDQRVRVRAPSRSHQLRGLRQRLHRPRAVLPRRRVRAVATRRSRGRGSSPSARCRCW